MGQPSVGRESPPRLSWGVVSRIFPVGFACVQTPSSAPPPSPQCNPDFPLHRVIPAWAAG